MRLPWIATCFVLGLIIVLDPTQTPAQYGRKGEFGGKNGEFGGKRMEFGGKRERSFAFPGGPGNGFQPRSAYTPGGPAPAMAVPAEKPAVFYGSGGAPADTTRSTIMLSPSGVSGSYQIAPSGGGFDRSQFGGGGGYGGERPAFGGGGFPGGGPSSFSGGGPSSFGGGGPGGPRGFDPASMWDRMSRGRDSINLNDPENSRMRGMMERFGTPIPANGILTKDAYMAEAQKRMGSMATPATGGGPGGTSFVTMSGSMSPDGRMTFSPGFGGPPSFGGPGGFGGDRGSDRDRGAERLRDQDRNNDGRVSRDEADRQLQPNFERIDRNGDGEITLEEYRGYYAAQQSDRDRDRDRDRGRDMGNWAGGGFAGGGWGGAEMGGWGNRQDPRGTTDEARPVAVRYGHLPKDINLPEWFHEYDTTKDAQIALHEWMKGAKAAGETATVESFAVYDLNGDQLITVEEVLRYERLQSDARRIAAIQQGESTRPSFASPGGGRMREWRGGAPGASAQGSLSDKSVTPSESGKGNRDSEKPERKKGERKSEKNDAADREPAGSNGPWGNGGKKRN